MHLVDEHGFPTSKAALAQDHWLRLTPPVRTKIASQIPMAPLKSYTERAIQQRDLAHLRACHAFVAEHLLDFHIVGAVLTASLKPIFPPGLSI